MPGMGWHYGPCNPKTGAWAGGILLIIAVIIGSKYAHGIEHFIGDLIIFGLVAMGIIVPLSIYGCVRAIINANKGAICICNDCLMERALAHKQPIQARITNRSISDTTIRPAITDDRGLNDYRAGAYENNREHMDR